MSNNRYQALSVAGSEIIPTTNGTYYTPEMLDAQGNRCIVYIAFFSDALGTSQVTPTGGIVQVFGKADTPATWDQIGSDIPAVKCSSPISTYEKTIAEGRMLQGYVNLNGITGAAYAKITFWRYS